MHRPKQTQDTSPHGAHSDEAEATRNTDDADLLGDLMLATKDRPRTRRSPRRLDQLTPGGMPHTRLQRADVSLTTAPLGDSAMLHRSHSAPAPSRDPSFATPCAQGTYAYHHLRDSKSEPSHMGLSLDGDDSAYSSELDHTSLSLGNVRA